MDYSDLVDARNKFRELLIKVTNTLTAKGVSVADRNKAYALRQRLLRNIGMLDQILHGARYGYETNGN